MFTRLRHTVLLLVQIVRFSIATRTLWFLPLVGMLLLLMAIAGATEIIVPYALYPIF